MASPNVFEALGGLFAALGIADPNAPRHLLTTASASDYSAEEKAQKIEACLAQSPVNLWELRDLALSQGGLLECKLISVGVSSSLIVLPCTIL